jgi:glycosyltransferase involved in cell wall biosynthesis
MNILHINHSDTHGGAAIAGYRLHQGLVAAGKTSHLLVDIVKSKSPQVNAIPRNRKVEKTTTFLSSLLGINYINLSSSFGIVNHPFYQAADILQFHNLHSGYFNYLAIPALTKDKPAVFTLHDMWGITGHCSYSYDCDRWKTGCGKCPYLDVYPAIKLDGSHVEWQLKKWAYANSNIKAVVTASRWLMDLLQQSILSHIPIHHIPYGLDLDVFEPLDRDACRQVLGIPLDKKVLIFGVPSLSDSRKGGDLVVKALQGLPDSLRKDTVLLVMGDGEGKLVESIDMPVVSLGFISGDRLRAIAYSAADLTLFPTRADNLPLTLQESIACGVPVVSFKVGGVPEVIRPGQTGYLSLPDNVEDFRNGIIELLEDHEQRSQMARTCREIACQEYTLDQQAQRYIELYEHILQNKS